ncbi:MAG TPA: ATP-binding protein [Anaeromyxobacteraceae bacterium]|nr:ATP-binding protein [Anaeromyxobacteraceae bacterium]
MLVLAPNPERASFEEFIQGLREVLSDRDALGSSIEVEGLPAVPAAGGEDRLVAWMARKYEGQPFDAVVATAGAPLDQVLALRDHLWPGARVLTVEAGITAQQESERLPGVSLRADPAKAVDLARRLLPGTARIVYVGGPGYGNYGEVTTAEALSRASGLPVETVPPLSIEDLQKRLASLPSDAVVFYGSVYRDRDGRRFLPTDALELIAARSSRPILSFSDTHVGHGALGGIVFDSREIGRQLGELVHSELGAGAAAAGGPVRRLEAATLVLLDGRELERWQVPDSALPPGAQVRFRVATLWESHRAAVVGVALALAAAAVLIGWLLAERRKRAAAEGQLRRLSAGVIQAQELERGRVSRELHDDVSQRLALAALEVDRLSRAANLGDEERRQVRAIQDQLRTLGRDVHDIAYRLRPTEIEFVGLVPALRALAASVSSAGRMAVEVVDAGWPTDAGPEAGIVLFRVAQEALQNCMKHSGASEARVIVSGDVHHLTLSVQDDGRGFDTAAGTPPGRLGLAGMRERIRQVGGAIAIESLPGEGTRVEATVPRPVTLGLTEDVRHA